jgi:hypothetical protein
MDHEQINNEIKRLNREHVENFVKYGADSIDFKNYIMEYDKKVEELTEKIKNG